MTEKNGGSEGKHTPEELQAEWEFVQVLQENYAAAKNAEKYQTFKGYSPYRAILETYKDLLAIIKHLPTKRVPGQDKATEWINTIGDNQLLSENAALKKELAEVKAEVAIIKENFFYSPDEIAAIKNKAYNEGYNACIDGHDANTGMF